MSIEIDYSYNHESKPLGTIIERVEIDGEKGAFIPEDGIAIIRGTMNKLIEEIGSAREHGQKELIATFVTGFAIVIEPGAIIVGVELYRQNDLRKKHMNEATGIFRNFTKNMLHDGEGSTSLLEKEIQEDYTPPPIRIEKVNDNNGIFIPEETTKYIRLIFERLKSELVSGHEHSQKRLIATIVTIGAMFVNPLSFPLAAEVIRQNQKAVGHQKKAGKLYDRFRDTMLNKDVLELIDNLTNQH